MKDDFFYQSNTGITVERKSQIKNPELNFLSNLWNPYVTS